jgi:hypothetical protein
MGRQFFSAAYYFLEPESVEASFVDMLNYLEKMGFVPDGEEWLEFRTLRNQVSHEYPEKPEYIVANLNMLIERMPRFLSIYRNFVNMAVSRELISIP